MPSKGKTILKMRGTAFRPFGIAHGFAALKVGLDAADQLAGETGAHTCRAPEKSIGPGCEDIYFTRVLRRNHWPGAVMYDTPLSVAVIGASGIGQHHARWYDLSGCDVVAFAGTSRDSCERTRARLASYFGFRGRAYQDVEAMLREETPDIVAVTSPYPLHRAHAIAALDAGAHVLCEKPFCWDKDKELDEILADGRAVVSKAKDAGRLLGVSAQYPAGIPHYRAFYEQVRGAWDDVTRITMEMEVKGRKGPKRYEEIWADVAPHALSLVIGFLPDGRMDATTAVCEIEERENRARFDYVSGPGRCGVELVMRDIDEGIPARRFGVNGFMVDWEGYVDDDEIYRARLVHGSESVQCDDFLHILVDAFVSCVRGSDGRPVVSGADGLLGLEYQVELLRIARGQVPDRPQAPDGQG